jgi:hypothetical protein
LVISIGAWRTDVFRSLMIFVLTGLILNAFCQACECTYAERPCEYLRTDALFVGRVIETTAVKHPMEKDSWATGYSMRFAVDESLTGELGTEVSVETGNGGGDCGTPLPVGGRFLVFAYRAKDGKLWTGMCSGNQPLTGDAGDDSIVEQYRKLVKQDTGTIFGRVTHVKPVWREDEVDDESGAKPIGGVVLHANSEKFEAAARTQRDGLYEFVGLPVGKYKVIPDAGNGLDFDREYENRYEADLKSGQCANISFKLEPSTRIQGRVILPAGLELKTLDVAAIPTHLRKLNQFSGKWDFTDEHGRFDLWSLPPGDYYVGVNINSSPKEDAPFPPTYYPGVTSEKAASIVRVKEGEVKDLELVLPEVAATRTIHFTAIGLDGRPLRKIYIQTEDLRHPGDAASYVNVDLDNEGSGTLTVYAGYAYHLHGSHWVSYGNDWCSKPVVIPAGTKPVQARFIMDRKSANCDIYEIDGIKR